MNDQFTSIKVSKNTMKLNSTSDQNPPLEDTGAFSEEGLASSSSNSSNNSNTPHTMLALSESQGRFHDVAAIVYEHAQFSGRFSRIQWSWSMLPGFWDNFISSILVYPHKCITV